MIKDFSVTNFKAFKDSGRLPLAPLACLLGRNSSGKSTLTQALLLLRQSADEQAPGSSVPSLRLNGEQVELGTYGDLIRDHDEGNSLGLSFTFEIDLSKRERSWAPLVAMDVPRQARRARYIPHLYRLQGAPTSFGGVLSLKFIHQEPFGPALTEVALQIENHGAVRILRARGKQREQHWRVYMKGLPKKSLEPVFPYSSLFPRLHPRQGANPNRLAPGVQLFAELANATFWDLQDFLEGIRFLGPFRTPPQRRYLFSGFGAPDVGISGQQAIDLLISESLIRKTKREQSLRRAVAFWLRRLKLASSLDIAPLAKRASLFEVLLANAGHRGVANFADVGFGVSQVLPVLVQGLMTPRGGLYVVQQPELHLHPDAQAELVDFFLYLSSMGIRCLVETHSEYLLVRLRRRLAEGSVLMPGGQLAEEGRKRMKISRGGVAVLLVDESDSGETRLRSLEIGKDFQFTNMPAGFMDQAVSDRIALMKAIRP